jgi:hypothetical protein
VTSASIPLAVHRTPKLLRTDRPLRLSRDLGKVPAEKYRLVEKDGRKWRAIARDRMSLAEWLAIHGDGDGSRIFPSVASMTRHFGWSRSKTFYLLEDLKTLGLLVRDPDGQKLTGEHGTRIRRMDLAAFLRRAGVQDSQASPGAGVQDSRAGVQDSRAEVQSNVGHNRHLTDTKKTPKAASAVENRKSARNPAAQTAASSPVPLSRTENRKLLPQQIEYARVSRLADGAMWVYQKAKPSGIPPDRASWKEDLKCWAARNDIPYDGDSIEKALDLTQRRISEHVGAAAANGSRRSSAQFFAEGMCVER